MVEKTVVKSVKMEESFLWMQAVKVRKDVYKLM